jgi:LTXXQ motif family protein
MWKTRVSTYAVGAAACLAAVGGLAQAAQKPAGGGAHPVFHAVGGGGGGHPAFHPSGPAHLNVGPSHVGTPHITTRNIGTVGPAHLPATTFGTHAITTNKLTPTKIIANPALAHHLATLKTNPHNFALHRNLAANSALHPFLTQHMNQHHHQHLGWVGPLFWPFAYGSFFFFALWPDDYGFSDPFWAYGYNDIYEGIFSPYVYDQYVQGPGAPARMTQLAQGMADACATEAAEVTGWPIDQIQATVEPNDQQKALLDDLGNAVVQASDTIKSNCPTSVAFTPTGRLAAMQQRLQGMLQAVNIVEPPLDKFYGSLNDEQKARFDAMGAATAGATTADAATAGQARRNRPPAEGGNPPAACGSNVTTWPADKIDRIVQPTDAQRAKLDALQSAAAQASDTIKAACPSGEPPHTPPGRLAAAGKRLQALLNAVETVQPALQDFYNSLGDDQRARFNTMGRQLSAVEQ